MVHSDYSIFNPLSELGTPSCAVEMACDLADLRLRRLGEIAS